MNVFIMTGAALLLVALMVLLVVSAVHGYFMLRNPVPYVVLPAGALSVVIRELEIRPDDSVYDLGCGDGRVLRAFHRSSPLSRYVGVENDWTVWALAKLQTKSAQVVRGEIASTALGQATRVFAYLGPEMMAELEPRFERELPDGARIVSVQFPLPHRKPDKIVELEDSLSHATRLYVYTY